MAAGAGESGAAGDPQAVATVSVDVAFEVQVASGRWALEQWRVASIAPSEDPQALQIALHRDEAEGCWLNLTTDEPSVFVLWRREEGESPRAIDVTVSYARAAGWMDGGEQVDRVPMPEPMRPWVAEFVDRHYRPEAGRGKRRGPKPSFMRGEERERMTEEERRRFGGTVPGVVKP
jgi:hypothetical protein